MMSDHINEWLKEARKTETEVEAAAVEEEEEEEEAETTRDLGEEGTDP